MINFTILMSELGCLCERDMADWYKVECDVALHFRIGFDNFVRRSIC